MTLPECAGGLCTGADGEASAATKLVQDTPSASRFLSLSLPSLSPAIHTFFLVLRCSLRAQVAFARELTEEHLASAAAKLLEDPPSASSTAGKTQLVGLLQGMLYTIIGLGSTLGGDWTAPPGAWAVVGQVQRLLAASDEAPAAELGKDQHIDSSGGDAAHSRPLCARDSLHKPLCTRLPAQAARAQHAPECAMS